MSARRDAERVRVLVEVVESFAAGKPQTLGDLLPRLFGWDLERTFLAIDAAMRAGLIAPNGSGVLTTAPANDTRRRS